MTLAIDRFFTIIKNGSWHSIDEMSQQLGVETSKLAEFSKFLSEHGLLKYDDRTDKIRIEPVWKLLLPKEDESVERKTTIATFIIPPETSIDVQSTRFSNISNSEVEISLRIDNTIKEVAIRV